MRDLKIKPGMDTPKAKLKNPAPKDAESILKKHMDERQTEKEPENRDPVHYATDRVEGNMRRGAAAAANISSSASSAAPTTRAHFCVFDIPFFILSPSASDKTKNLFLL